MVVSVIEGNCLYDRCMDGFIGGIWLCTMIHVHSQTGDQEPLIDAVMIYASHAFYVYFPILGPPSTS